MSYATSKQKRRLGLGLLSLFAFALVMGPGPGVFLVNPDPTDPSAARFIFGIPIVYAWAGFWLGVQGLVVILAYRFLWNTPEPGNDE